jgi:hypothetical protein
MMTECVGRFQFTLPDGFAAAGRSQSIYSVDVRTVPIPPSGPDEIWKQEMIRIRGLAAPEGVDTTVLSTPRLGPTVSAVWYHPNPARKELLALDAAKPFRDHVLQLSRGADLRGMTNRPTEQRDAQATVERLVGNVIGAYVPQTNRGFCIGFGAITSKPSRSEQSLISFAHRSLPDIGIRFQTRTVATPDATTYSDLHEEARFAGVTGSQLTVLSEGNRLVAGFSGKEIRILVTPRGGPAFVRFTWHFGGGPFKGDAPAIDILGSSPAQHRALLESAWDTLLQSMRGIPL